MEDGQLIRCTFSNIKHKEKPKKPKDIVQVQATLKPTDITIEQLAEALVHGCSFRPGVLNGRKASDWTQQQLFGLDFDDGLNIEEAYTRAMGLGLIPVFMYTTFSHTSEHHKFRMIFCNDVVITDGNLRDKLQATLMGMMGEVDPVCKNRDRLFFGGKSQEVLYPAYSRRIHAEEIIQKYWKEEYAEYIPGVAAKNKKKKVTTPAAQSKKKVTQKNATIAVSDNTDAISTLNISLLQERLGLKGVLCDTDNKNTLFISITKIPQENLNVKAIKEHDVEFMRKILAHEPIEFETKQEFWDFIYHDLDIAELLDIDNPRSFCCVLHEDHNPSANIFMTQNGVQKYHCASENLTLNIKQLIEWIGNYKSEYKAVQFIMDIYNLSVKESQWSIEQRENIDMMIRNITMNKFKELCPQADKNIKYAKDTFLMMLSIARENIYSEKFSNDDGEIIFFVTNKRLAESMGKGNSQRSRDKVAKYVKMLIYHDLLRILDDSQIPKELLAKAIKYSGTDKRVGKHVNFYAIPSWVVQQLQDIESNGVRWKENGYRMDGISYDMFYRTEGIEVAAALYPQYKKKKSENGDIVDRTTTKPSDERTMKIAEVILNCIQAQGYCTENDVVFILAGKYQYSVTQVQIKRCLKEILDTYGLKKIKANKELKEKFNIDSKGYPNIIIEDTI